MTLFLVITSVINIGLGYALAVYLSRTNSQWQPRLDVPCEEEVAAPAPEETSAEASADEGNDEAETPQFVPPTAEEIEAAQTERERAAAGDVEQTDNVEETAEETASASVDESDDGEDASDDSEGAVEGEELLEVATG